MSKHTPGPWKVVADDEWGGFEIRMGSRLENAGIFKAIHELKYADNTFEEEKNYAEAYANACLMAAAPDMLEALQMVRSLFVAVSQLSKATSGDQNIFETIEKAIDKAEGRENEI